MFHNTLRVFATLQYVLAKSKGLEGRRHDLLTGHGVENLNNIRLTLLTSVSMSLISLCYFGFSLSINALCIFCAMFFFSVWYIKHLPDYKLTEELEHRLGKDKLKQYKSFLGGRILITPRGISLSLTPRNEKNIVRRRVNLEQKLLAAKQMHAEAKKQSFMPRKERLRAARLKAQAQNAMQAQHDQAIIDASLATAKASAAAAHAAEQTIKHMHASKKGVSSSSASASMADAFATSTDPFSQAQIELADIAKAYCESYAKEHGDSAADAAVSSAASAAAGGDAAKDCASAAGACSASAVGAGCGVVVKRKYGNVSRARALVGAMLSDRPCSDAEDYVIAKALKVAQMRDEEQCAALNSGYMSIIETPLLSGVRLYPGIPMTDACCCQLISAIAAYINAGADLSKRDGDGGVLWAAARGAGKAMNVVGNMMSGGRGGHHDEHVLGVSDSSGRSDNSQRTEQWVPPLGPYGRKLVKPKDVTFWGFGFLWGTEHTRLLHEKQEIGLRRAAYGSSGSPDIHAIGGQYKAYEPIYLPESNLKGHTLLLGTTGAGKTRFFDLEISQAIARGDTVIVIDPKGDRQLQRSIVRAARDAGRDPLQELFILDVSRKQFSPGSDEHSVHCYERCRGLIKPFGGDGSDDSIDSTSMYFKNGLEDEILEEVNEIADVSIDHDLMTTPCDSLIPKEMFKRAASLNPSSMRVVSNSADEKGQAYSSDSYAGKVDDACKLRRTAQDEDMLRIFDDALIGTKRLDERDIMNTGSLLRAALADDSNTPVARIQDMDIEGSYLADWVAPAASAFAGSTGRWQGKELDVDDVIINCSNVGINPVGAFDQPAQIGARLTSMLSSQGSSASFKNYSNMAVTAAVVCCQLTGKRVTVENIRDLVTDPNSLQVALRSYINYKVEHIKNEAVQRLWNTIHGVGGPLNRVSGVVSAALGPQATGEAPVGKYHELIDTLIKAGKVSKNSFKEVLTKMKHSPTRPSKDALLTLFGNIANLDPVHDSGAIAAMTLSLFDGASERKAAEEACSAGYDDEADAMAAAEALACETASASVGSGSRSRYRASDSSANADETDILFANREVASGIEGTVPIIEGAALEDMEELAPEPTTTRKRTRKSTASSKTASKTTTRKTASKAASGAAAGRAGSAAAGGAAGTAKKTTRKKAPATAASKKRIMCAEADNEVLQAFYDWLCRTNLCDDLVDCKIVFMVTGLPVEYYRKVTNSVVPYLGSLSGGALRGLLSGDKNGQALPSLRDLIEGNKIFIADIHCLKDATTGQNLGKMLLSDLAFVAGDINATGMSLPRISVFIDEASELADEALVQLLNKSRSAGFSITIATQSFADLSRRSGSKDAAHQIVANCNNLISMRVNDPETASIVSSVLPHTSVGQRSSSITYGTDALVAQATIGHSVMMHDSSLFPPDALMMLPDFEYVARFSDGSFYKGFIPRMAPDDEVYPDLAKHRAAAAAGSQAGAAGVGAACDSGSCGAAAGGAGMGGEVGPGIKVEWPGEVDMFLGSKAARQSSLEVPPCFKYEYSDDELRGKIEGFNRLGDKVKSPGLISLHHSEHHLEDMVEETKQASYAVYRNPEGFKVGAKEHSFKGIESPVHYFKERISWIDISDEPNASVRAALLAALPLLGLKYVCGSALIVFIYLWQWFRAKILSNAVVELLSIVIVVTLLSVLNLEEVFAQKLDLLYDMYCYYCDMSENLSYCIEHKTLFVPELELGFWMGLDEAIGLISVFLFTPEITLSCVLLGFMIGSRNKLISAMHHSTPSGSGLLSSFFQYMRFRPILGSLIFIALSGLLLSGGFILAVELAYLGMAMLICSMGYYLGCAVTRHAK